MQKHGLRLARIVEDMLTISRFESIGEHEAADLRELSFSVEECVKDVLDRLQPVIEEKQARIELEFPAGRQPDRGRSLLLGPGFFQPHRKRAQGNHQPGLVIGVGMAPLDGGGLQLWVRDNGVGIPRVDLPFVFKRFYRVAKHHGQEIKGTGLGLSIVRRAVEAHGGTIAVDSTPGQRTQFTITLPPPAETPAPAPNASVPMAS